MYWAKVTIGMARETSAAQLNTKTHAITTALNVHAHIRRIDRMTKISQLINEQPAQHQNNSLRQCLPLAHSNCGWQLSLSFRGPPLHRHGLAWRTQESIPGSGEEGLAGTVRHLPDICKVQLCQGAWRAYPRSKPADRGSYVLVSRGSARACNPRRTHA